MTVPSPEHTAGKRPRAAPNPLWRYARRIAVGIIGLSVLLFGVALLVLPGPGLLVIFAGLSILALEFAWARALVKKARAKTAELARRTAGSIRNDRSD